MVIDMKKLLFFVAFICCVTANAQTDYSGDHECVDLGLSVKWATCNLGADNPWDYGDYYPWGRIKMKGNAGTEYPSELYQINEHDRTIAGIPALDAATANWGDCWRIPTVREFEELFEKCQFNVIVMHGHRGYNVTGPSGNSIFLPFSGECVLDEAPHGIDKYGVYLNSNFHLYSNEEIHVHMAFMDTASYGMPKWSDSPDDELRYSVRPVLGKYEDATIDDIFTIIDDTDDNDFIIVEDGNSTLGGETVKEESIPFQLVEEKPIFQGGDANQFSKWVNQRLVYPAEAKENGVQGRVTLKFIIEKDGSLVDVKVLRGIHPVLDNEAVRVVSMSPKWTPGRQRNRNVPVSYTFPVIFQLK